MKIYITPYNILRTLLAINTLLALIMNDNYILFGNLIETGVYYEKLGLFNILSNNLLLAKSISIIALLLIVAGVYPKYTAIIHYYISYSFIMATDVNFGADRIASNILLLLIPLSLIDKRKNHFLKSTQKVNRTYWFFYTAISIQIALIYFHAFYEKILIKEWSNGTAVFYYITHNEFGLGRYSHLSNFLLNNKPIIYLMTWGSLLLEFLLSIYIICKSKFSFKIKYLLLYSGILFHFILTFVHGLLPFLLVMSGVLAFYILPRDFQKSIYISSPKILT